MCQGRATNFHIRSGRGCGLSPRRVRLTWKFRWWGRGATTETTNHTYFRGKLNSRNHPHLEQRADSFPQARRRRGPSAGPARAPSPLEQSLDTGRNFPERKRRGSAGSASRSVPAAAAPQLPEGQEAPAPPAGPGPRPGAPPGKRAEGRTSAGLKPDSGGGR